MADDPLTAATHDSRTSARGSMVPHLHRHPVVLRGSRRRQDLRKESWPGLTLRRPSLHSPAAPLRPFRDALRSLCAAIATTLWRPITIARIVGMPVQMHPRHLDLSRQLRPLVGMVRR